MEEGRLVGAQPLHHDVHDCSRGHKSRFRVSHDASPLQCALVQPPIHKSESLAAVVVRLHAGHDQRPAVA